MRVKAKFANGKFGFYGGVRRRDGDVFDITDPAHFSKTWMKKVDDEKTKRKGRSPAADESEDSGAE